MPRALPCAPSNDEPLAGRFHGTSGLGPRKPQASGCPSIHSSVLRFSPPDSPSFRLQGAAARFSLPQASSLLSLLCASTGLSRIPTLSPTPTTTSKPPGPTPPRSNPPHPSNYRKDSSGASGGSCPCPSNLPWSDGTHLDGRESGRRYQLQRTNTQDGITPGKGRGLPTHIYSTLKISRDHPKSRLSARAQEPPPRTGALLRKRSSTPLPSTSPPTSSRYFAGSHRAGALSPWPHPLHRYRLCARVLSPGGAGRPPPVLPRPRQLWRAGQLPRAAAAHPAKWRR